MKDFIIVGRGLAASCLMHQFHKEGISFIIIGDPSLSRSSQVAAGIWNPLVFKRLTKSWMVDELVPVLTAFYRSAERLTGSRFMTERNILRIFSEKQEEELWQKKSRNELDDYIDQKIYSSEEAPAHSKITGHYGKVLQAGNIDLPVFIEATENFFSESVVNGHFDHLLLRQTNDCIHYKDLEAKNIVFCEGWLVKDNPFFDWVPMKPAKGEVLTVEIPGFDIGADILNRSSFLFKISATTFRSGATYEWDRLDEVVTEAALNELEEKLRLHTDLEFKVTRQEAGVRPSAIDRRPVIGHHPAASNIFIFNGLGTKGVMLAPYFVQKFVHFYLQKSGLPAEANVSRFYHLYEKKAQGQDHRSS